MKKIKNLCESDFLKLFFAFVSLCFLIAAVCMSDRSTMLSGLLQILSSPPKLSTNYFSVGGYAATFLNMGLVGMICTGLYCIPGKKENHVATLATVLTTGFGAWGIHPMNMWPGILGVILYGKVHKEKLGGLVHAMLFSTGLAPLMSELLFRYPHASEIGFNGFGLILTLIVGGFIGSAG